MKTSKKSLLLSIVSIILCLAMLLGTTYAWFTDSVQSGTNQIVAGNLDVELYNADGKVTKDTKLFSKVELWEPGVVAYETLTVKNEGNLAFNYQMSILTENEVAQGDVKLSEILKVGVIDGAVENGITRETLVGRINNWMPLQSFSQQDSIDAGGADVTKTYVIYWQPGENDNLYNMNNENHGKTLSIDLGVKLVAGQKTKEVDSFNDQYDYSAFIQVNPENFEGIIAGLKGGENLYLKAGTYTVSANDKLRIEKSNVTIVGAGVDATVIDAEDKTCSGQAGLLVTANNVTIANLTVKSAPTDENTAKNTSPIKVTDLFGTDGDTIIENFKLENVALEGSMGHGLNLHGVDGATINGVDVRTYSKCAIACAKATDVTFTNNKTAANGWGDIGCMYDSTKQGYESPCSITIGEGNNFGKGLIYSERPASAPSGKDTITFEDPSAWVVTSTDAGISAVAAAAKIGTTGYATLQEAVNVATAENDVVMLKDVTSASGYAVTIPASASVSIDGNGHTVSFAGTAAFFLDKNASSLTLKNTKVVKLDAQGRYGVLTPNYFGGSVSIDNCTLKNLKYGVYMDATKGNHANLSITNCTYDNTVWGYCFDNRPEVTTDVTVTFKDNTGIADDHIQESFA